MPSSSSYVGVKRPPKFGCIYRSNRRPSTDVARYCNTLYRWGIRHRIWGGRRILLVSVYSPTAGGVGAARRRRGCGAGRGRHLFHANPSNPIHYGKGAVKVFESTLFLEDNFKVGPRPKYHIYLIPKAGIQANGDLINQMCVDLNRLRTFKDSQNYRIPEGTDLASFKSVIIWCEQFNVLISPADLAFKTLLTIRQASHENREDRRFQL